MECDNIVNIVGITEDSPKLHSNLGGKGNKVVSKILNLVIGQIIGEDRLSLKLLHHSGVVIDTPLGSLLDLALVEKVIDANLPSVVSNKVAKSYSSLETKESSSKVEEKIKVTLLLEYASRSSSIVKALPRTAGRINLVRLKLASMLHVSAILVNEVPNNAINLVFRPTQPVLSGRLNIEDSPAIKLCGVHLANLILSTMLATIDGGDDDGILVKMPSVDLAAVG